MLAKFGGERERSKGGLVGGGEREKRTVSDEAAEISADYAVPGGTFLLIELLDVC